MAESIGEWVEIKKLNPWKDNPRLNQNAIDEVATSIKRFGFASPIIAREKDSMIIAGHTRFEAAKKIGLKKVPVRFMDLDLNDAQLLALADNKIAETADWDPEKLKEVLSNFDDQDLDGLGWSDEELSDLMDFEPPELLLGDPDDIPEVDDNIITQEGDLWILGNHRLLCGDSTREEDVAQLMDGKKAVLLHADPPYGMGKEKDGVLNDNLYKEKLDKFQMSWWKTFRPFLVDNSSSYIWGNAEDLWRLWFAGGLSKSEHLELRNEIVWDKKSIAGMRSPLLTQYPITTERCLFFQVGKQFLGNINSWDFPEHWEPLLSYLKTEAKKAGLSPKKIKEITNTQMYSHWFSNSQFTLIPQKHYVKLQQSFTDCFHRTWEDLKKEWDSVRLNGVHAVRAELQRSFFDNAHETMKDVWEFPRVTGEERYGHATPKPVQMMERAIKSSSREKDLVVEPFGGSGSTLIACEKINRKCFIMELDPMYCDVIVRRWQNVTGKEAVNQNGQSFNDVSDLPW